MRLYDREFQAPRNVPAALHLREPVDPVFVDQRPDVIGRDQFRSRVAHLLPETLLHHVRYQLRHPLDLRLRDRAL